MATAAGVPLQRIGEPEEVSKAILFLASDEASYVTGTQIVVDGEARLANYRRRQPWAASTRPETREFS